MSLILVVDDDVDWAEAVRNYLNKSGYSVECASDGKEALDFILRKKPNLIILDLLMPKLDGYGLLGILRSYLRLNKLRVIVVSAQIENGATDRLRGLKVERVLLKGKATLKEIAEAARLELSAVVKE